MKRQEGFDRIVNLSDGVIAIAITLLALDVRLPEFEYHSSSDLRNQLVAIAPQYVGYFMSFLAIGVLWMGHHRRFNMIERYDRTLVTLNLLFLAAVSFMPFPTKVMVEYNDSVSISFYSLIMVTASSLLVATWSYAIWRDLIEHSISINRKIWELISGVSVCVVFGISAVVAQYDKDIAVMLWVAVVPITHLCDKHHKHSEKEQ